MPAPNAITPDELSRLVGTAGCPRIVDLRSSPARAIPGAMPGDLQHAPSVDTVIVVDRYGGTGAVAAAAMMRSDGKDLSLIHI